MVSRSNKVTLDNWIANISPLDFQHVKEQFCHNIAMNEDQIADYCFLDRSNSGMDLYWFEVSNGDGALCYFVLADSAYQIKALQTEKSLQSIPSLIEFKHENGWYAY